MLKGEKILVTGGQGPVSGPVVRALAECNDVHVLARFSRPGAKEAFEAIGVTPVQGDLLESFDHLADDYSYVFHSAYVPGPLPKTYHPANAQLTGRLMYHCRAAKGFLYASSCSIYDTTGTGLDNPIKESHRLGPHFALDYTLMKNATEEMIRFISMQFGIPASIIRIAACFGPSGGSATVRLDKLVAGEPIELNPDKPTYYRSVYETDGVAPTIAAMRAASSPPLVVNWGADDIVSIEEYLAYMGELTGLTPNIVYTDRAYTHMVPDLSLMHETIGHAAMPWREAMRRLVEARYPELLKPA